MIRVPLPFQKITCNMKGHIDILMNNTFPKYWMFQGNMTLLHISIAISMHFSQCYYLSTGAGLIVATSGSTSYMEGESILLTVELAVPP